MNTQPVSPDRPTRGTDPAPGQARAEAPTSSDRIRQVVVTISFLLCIVGSAIGIGALGGQEVEDAAGGALSESATLLAPAGSAFSIWSVIYLGLGAYTTVQWIPRWAADPRQRSIGYLAAASMLLNAAWIFTVQGDQLLLGVVVIVALLAVLCAIVVRLHRTAPAPGSSLERNGERLVVDGTFGLYLGWVTVATAADIAATLADSGFDGGPLDPEVWAIIVLAAVALIGAALARAFDGRVAPALSIVWGLVWIAVGRSSGEPESSTTAVAALVAAAVVAVATVAARLMRREPSAPRR